MELVIIAIIFFYLPNCDSNSRLVVDEDDNGKLRLERVDFQNIAV